ARVTKATSPVGADALVRPPAQAATTAQAARSDCAAVGGSAVLRMRRAPCGQAERAEGG
ncbi:Bacterial mobilisation domain-containing protein, partial [Dysosmobacter welbionis]